MTPRTQPRRRRVAGVGVLLAGCLLLVGCQAADQQPASGAPTPTDVAGGRSAGGRPVLRLITCGGSFDRGSGHYRDNVIVYAAAT